MRPNTTINRRLAAGLCPSCGEKPEEGKRQCRRCLDDQKERAKRYLLTHKHTRQVRIEKGLCQCGQPPEIGFKQCAQCREKSKLKQRRISHRNRSKGLCRCGANPVHGRISCQACNASSKIKSEKRKQRGVCKTCASPSLPGLTYCEVHQRRMRERMKKQSAEYRSLVFDHYGRKCECCGETIIEFLTIDHVDGGGTKHRKTLGGKSGTWFYRWLVKQGFPKGYRTLCYNCNCGRHHRGDGVCPHERMRREITAGNA